MRTAPGGLRATVQTYPSITARWNAVSGATQYRVRYRAVGSDRFLFTDVSQTTAELTIESYETYEIHVAVRSPDGTVGSYAETTARHATPIAQPRAPSVESGRGEIGVSWSRLSGATEYVLRISTDEAGVRNPREVRVDGALGSYTFGNVVGGTEYYVAIRGARPGYTTPWSAAARCRPRSALAPPQIRNVVASPGTIDILWNPVSGADVYHVRISGDEAGLANAQTIALGAGSDNYSFRFLLRQTYYVSIRASDGRYESAWGPAVSATPPPTVDNPQRPTARSGHGSISVSWPSVGGAMWYRVRLSTDVAGNRVVRTVEIEAPTRTHVFEDVTPGTEYYIAVQGYVHNYESPWSEPVSATPKPLESAESPESEPEKEPEQDEPQSGQPGTITPFRPAPSSSGPGSAPSIANRWTATVQVVLAPNRTATRTYTVTGNTEALARAAAQRLAESDTRNRSYRSISITEIVRAQ